MVSMLPLFKELSAHSEIMCTINTSDAKRQGKQNFRQETKLALGSGVSFKVSMLKRKSEALAQRQFKNRSLEICQYVDHVVCSSKKRAGHF